VYKNPKKAKAGESGAKTKGASAMQPAASALDGQGVKIMRDSASMRINEGAFLRKKESDVPVDQVFFHRFFKKKNEREQAKASKASKKTQGDEDEDTSSEGENDEGSELDGEDEGSVLDEQEVWKAMKASIPKIPEDDALSEESDELPSDFDMSEEEEDDDEDDELAEASDNDDLLSLDADGPESLIEYDGTDSEWGGIETEEVGEKRKRRDEWKERRKKLRSLPTFASYDEYAKMIEDGPEDDI